MPHYRLKNVPDIVLALNNKDIRAPLDISRAGPADIQPSAIKNFAVTYPIKLVTWHSKSKGEAECARASARVPLEKDRRHCWLSRLDVAKHDPAYRLTRASL